MNLRSKNTRRLVWKDFFIRVLLPSLLAISLYIYAEYMFVIPAIEKHTIEQRQEMLQELTNSAISVLDFYHQKELRQEISKEEAQQSAIAILRDMKYGKDKNGYFWINDMKPGMLMHPLFPEVDYFELGAIEDYNGNKIFVEIAEMVRTQKEGIITYKWQWDNKSEIPLEKQSYVKGFEPWGWIVGTGIYIEDLKAKVSQIKTKVLLMSVPVIVVISLMLFIIVMFNIKTVRNKYSIEKQLIKSTEDAMESEARFKALHNASFGGIAIHYKGIILDCNQGLSDLTGYTNQELIGMNGLLLFSKECHEVVKSHILTGFKEPYESIGLTKEGKEYPLRIDAKEIPYNGTIARVVEFRDISQQKQAEKRLYQLSTAVEQSANIIVMTDTDGNIEYTNPRFTEVTGYQAEEVLGKNPRILKTKDKSQEEYKHIWDTIKSGKIWRGEFKNKTKAGDIYYERAVITPIKNEKGNIVNFLSAKEDITEEKKHKEQLIQNEKRFKLLSESTFEAIFITQSGIVIDVNNSALELTQRTYNELYGSSLVDFIDEEHKVEAYQNFINNKGKNFETIGVRKDGSKVEIEVRNKIVKLNNETYSISAVRDITEKKLAARKLVESQNSLFYKVLEAEEKERIRISTDLHDGVGPDLYSLKLHLNAIENASSLEDAMPIIQKSYKIIEESSINLKSISKALSPYLLKDFGLDSAIKNYIEDIKISKVDVQYQSNIKKTRFFTEIEVSCFRIVKELINNSLKHSEADIIDIKLNQEQEKLVLNYSDNGKGFNVDETLNTNIPKPNFGLKNISSRVKSMKGSMEIRSELGEGIEVDIKLPLVLTKSTNNKNKFI